MRSSSLYSAQLAAQLRRPYAFALQFGNADVDTAMRLYRESFQLAAVLAEPYMLVSVSVAISDDPVEAYQPTRQERHIIYAYTDRSFHGTRATVSDRLKAFQGCTGADEMRLVVGGHSTSLDQEGVGLIANHYAMPHLEASLVVVAQ